LFTTWATWLAAGLDQHSQIADPLFVDTAKVFRPDYAPRGDFSVKASSPALGLGFKNFPMDSFGVMTITKTSSRMPFVKGNSSATVQDFVCFAHGKLIVFRSGDYKVVVTNALGKTMAVFIGRDTHSFAFEQATMAKGVYFAVIRFAQGRVMQKFLVN